jgi:hypothetical protein
VTSSTEPSHVATNVTKGPFSALWWILSHTRRGLTGTGRSGGVALLACLLQAVLAQHSWLEREG